MRGKTPAKIETAQPDYPLRVSSFFLSVGTHGLIVFALMFASFTGGSPDRPVYDEFVRPQEHILYYDLRQKVPDVAPIEKSGHSPQSRGAELSKLAIIANSPKPKSKEVFVSVPAPKIEVPQDVQAALLVAKLQALPPPPPPPKPRQFVPPPAATRETKLPMKTPVSDTQAPAIASSAVTPILTPPVTFSPFTAPPQNAPVAPTPAKGEDKADVAIASLHPTDATQVRLPTAELPAQFSKAPTQGAPASDDAGASVTVANLSIRQPKKDTAPPTPTKTLLYSDTVRNASVSTLSVPLRPANRMIPRSVDARFQGRNVYTMAVPIENMPAYDGDWILWFAEQESKPGETPLVRAPLPFRKIEPAVDIPPNGRTEERIQIAAVLRKNGRLDSITMLSKVTPAVQRAVLQDVTSWEFQPATRNGVPIDVDVVLEIPFNFPTAVARSTEP